MADNVAITPGTGATVAADDIGGVLYQRVKPTFGTDGSATDVSSSNPLPVVQTGALPAGTALVGKVGIDQTTVGTTNGVALAQIGANTVSAGNGTAGTGCQRVTIASDNTAFSVNAVQSGTWTVQPGNTANTTAWLATLGVNTTGGATAGKLISAASTNATSIKGSAGKLYMVTATNINASPVYVKFYNKATSPTVGTDTPVLTFLVPGGTTGAGTNIPIPAAGITFSLGIAMAITTGVADSNTGAVSANEVVINYAYN